MKAPAYPIQSEPVSNVWGRDVVDNLKANVIRPSEDIYPERNPNGTLLRIRDQGKFSRGGYPWSQVLFGHKIAGNKFIVMAGEIQYTKSIYASAETSLTIASDLTYVYVELEWATETATIKQSTDKAAAMSSDSCFRKWLYLLNYSAPSSVRVKLYGNGGGGAISIAPVFARPGT